jgi:hypothetical protein
MPESASGFSSCCRALNGQCLALTRFSAADVVDHGNSWLELMEVPILKNVADLKIVIPRRT